MKGKGTERWREGERRGEKEDRRIKVCYAHMAVPTMNLIMYYKYVLTKTNSSYVLGHVTG